MPARAKSDQGAWTLRFKKHKTTTLLLVQPAQSFESIKAELLNALKATGRNAIGGDELPSSPDDVVLGVLVDKNDPAQGWLDLEIPDQEQDGKKAKDSIFNSSPLGAGLKEGALLAFKFSEEADWDVVMPSYDDEDVA